MHNFSSDQLGPCVAFVTVVLDGGAREWCRGGGQRWDPHTSAMQTIHSRLGAAQTPNPLHGVTIRSVAWGNSSGARTPLRWVAQVSRVSANISALGNLQSPGSTHAVRPRLVGPQRQRRARPAPNQRSIVSLLKTCRGRAAPGQVQMSNCTRTFQAEFNFLLLTQGPGEQQLPQTAPKMHINRGIIPYYKGMHA